MEQSVDNFIDSIHKLGAVEGGLMLLKYHLEDNNPDDDLTRLEQAYEIISVTNAKLITTIRQCLKVKESDLASIKSLPHLSSISRDITSVVEIINHVKEANIPGKSEMIELLEDCAGSFLEERFIKVFIEINGDKSNFRQQILTLGDLCEIE